MGRQTCYCVSDGMRVLVGRGGEEYVDDLEALLQQLLCFIWEVMCDSLLRRRVRLIDVDSPDRSSKLNRFRTFSGVL